MSQTNNAYKGSSAMLASCILVPSFFYGIVMIHFAEFLDLMLQMSFAGSFCTLFLTYTLLAGASIGVAGIADYHGRLAVTTIALGVLAAALLLYTLCCMPFMYANDNEPRFLCKFVFALFCPLFISGIASVAVCAVPAIIEATTEKIAEDAAQHAEEVEDSHQQSVSFMCGEILELVLSGVVFAAFLVPLNGLLADSSNRGGESHVGGMYAAVIACCGTMAFSTAVFFRHRNEFSFLVRTSPPLILVRVAARSVYYRFVFRGGLAPMLMPDKISYGLYDFGVTRASEVAITNTAENQNTLLEEAHVNAPPSFSLITSEEVASEIRQCVTVFHHVRVLVVFWLLDIMLNRLCRGMTHSLHSFLNLPDVCVFRVKTVASLVCCLCLRSFLLRRSDIFAKWGVATLSCGIPPVRVRVLAGMVMVAIGAFMCTLVQLVFKSNGWLLIPFVVLGIGEAVIALSVLEISYVAAPQSLRSSFAALLIGSYWLSEAFGLQYYIWMVLLMGYGATGIILTLSLVATTAVAWQMGTLERFEERCGTEWDAEALGVSGEGEAAA